ncbi:aldehyde ferredoxin oxidoreductase, partial [candidate division KSB1 bacterium]|nr:aldehyde ferredoxin oxidoreductase [candidate division KSB1 bacterium]
MVGHCRKILTVNLSSGEIRSESFDEAFARKFLGGNGFAASLIHDRVPAGIDPFDEENALVVAVGPLTDTKIWGSSRAHLAAISPLTGFFADSNVGGNYPIAQKRAGFDAIFITGKSDTPSYLSITDDSCEIKKANGIWGLTTEETNRKLQQDHGPKAEVICIGPAGENCVL